MALKSLEVKLKTAFHVGRGGQKTTAVRRNRTKYHCGEKKHRKHDMLVCPVCDYVDLVKDRFKMHLQTHGLPATDLTSLVRESERDFTTLLSCEQPGCSFTTAYKRGLVTHQSMEHRLPYD